MENRKRYWWFNEASEAFMRNKESYLQNKHKHVSDRVMEIGKYAEYILNQKGFAEEFEEYMSRGYYSLSTPIWTNFGTSRGLGISCFNSFIDDSVDSILYTVAEVGVMSKHGGGTSGYFGKIRPRGSEIKDNGKSSGSVHFMQLFDCVTNVISQGSQRRGSFAAYLDIHHPDVDEFLKIRTEGFPIQDLSFGVCVPTWWLDEMRKGDQEKRKIWAKVIQLRSEIGYPYIFFTDNVNNNTVDVYKDKGMKIHASNLCIAGSERVVTDRGYLTAEELYKQGGELTLFNGHIPVKASDMKLREKDADVYKVKLENGLSLTATDYHGFPVLITKGVVKRTPLKELKLGDKVVVQTEKGLFGQKSFPKEAFSLGVYQAKGVEENLSLEPVDIFEKTRIPSWIWESDELTHWEYIKGLLYSVGVIRVNKNKKRKISVCIPDLNYELLKEVQLILNNLGLQSSIKPILDKQTDNENASYNENSSQYQLVMHNKSVLEIEKHTKFLTTKGFVLNEEDLQENRKSAYRVISIEYVGKTDVYCPTVYNQEHIFVASGMKTFNCSEIALPTNPNESFVCDLSSINLLHWDEIKNQPRVVHILVQLLDAVMTDFIERASKIRFMERAVEFAKNHRALGIGVLGLHSLYQSKLIPFESLRAKSLNNEIFKFLKEETYRESQRLAKIYGEPPVLKGYGRRNTTLLAIAPTTSSAFILGQVSQSIEPYNSNYFVKDVAKGKFTIKNPFLTQLLEEKGKNDYETWESILKAGGSVQHLNFLSQEEKDVFKTFGEISQKEIIIQASIRQKYIDQSQSLNLMIHPDTPAKEVNSLILFAHDQGIKTLYYQHSFNSAKEFSRDLLKCVNCE